MTATRENSTLTLITPPATVILCGLPSAPIAIVTVLPAPRSSSVMSPAALVVNVRVGWPVTAADWSQ